MLTASAPVSGYDRMSPETPHYLLASCIARFQCQMAIG
jgi:hypothetical protein